MIQRAWEFQTIDELREFVTEILCQNDQLEIGAFPVTQRLLVRRNQPCGIYFCLHGPRQHQAYAIWEAESNSVLFYGADGQRFHKTRLTAGPPLQPVSLSSR